MTTPSPSQSKRLTMVVAVGVALVGGCTGNSGSPSMSPQPESTHGFTTAQSETRPSTAAMPPPVVMGQEAIDGTFAFTVTRVVTGKDVHVLGDVYLYAQGTYVFVLMDVKNIGRSSQTYSADYQRLLDSEGRQHSPDMRATKGRYDPSNEGEYVDVNPGNTAGAALIFDVPKGTQPSQYALLLHSSADTRGVIANLT
jgi:hypothetical protein